MKKFNWKTLVLSISVVANLSLLISFCVLFNKNVKNNPENYIPSTADEVEGISGSGFKVSNSDFATYNKYDISISFEESPFSVLSVNTVTIKTGVSVLKGTPVGTYNGSDVLAPNDGCALNVEGDDIKKITFYSYNMFDIELPISTSDYYSKDYSKLSTPKLFVSSSVSYDVAFSSFDFSELDSSEKVIAKYKALDCTAILTEKSQVYLEDIQKQYDNFFYITNNNYVEHTYQTFQYIVNGKIETIQVYFEAIVQGNALISGKGLAEGLILYVY